MNSIEIVEINVILEFRAKFPDAVIGVQPEPFVFAWITHWRAVLFLLSSSNYGTCADSPFGKITPAEKGEKAVSGASPAVFPPFFSV